jgi:cytochrome c oxidase subunit 6a
LNVPHLHSTTADNMFAQRVLARSAPRMALRTQRAAPLRAARTTRNYSSESPKQFAGAEDNEFNRERARIAEHAYESGEFWRKLTL